jgi:hypothetical protein
MPKSHRSPQFAICVSNVGCEDLHVWKVYRVLPDKSASREAHVRVVDESGEDYIYPVSHFVFVQFARPVTERLLRSVR